MIKTVGTTARGIVLPIIEPQDDLASIVVEHVLKASQEHQYDIKDRDVIGITEAIVAKAQSNFATIDDIAFDVQSKFGDEHVGLVFPITSRNRFLNILKGIAKGTKKLSILMTYPQDEVGNPLVDLDRFYENESDQTFFTEAEFTAQFGPINHPFTGVNYVELYKSVAPTIDVYFSNHPKDILKITPYVINADIHERKRTKKRLLHAGAKKVYSLDDILNKPVNKSGYNEQYGLLGSNLSSDNQLKLFPRDAFSFVEKVQRLFFEQTGKTVEVLVYGDGGFKDPVCGIWELADPVVSPGFTSGLSGQPSEIKFKFVADQHLSHLSGDEKQAAMLEMIQNKETNERSFDEGTTPRRYQDLIGSLCDLMSGSGDKGTPVIHIQDYFKDYSTK